MLVNHQPWSEIQDRYRRHGTLWSPMLDLAERISGSKYATGLFAITSMHTLVIAQTPEFEFDHEVLKINYDPQTLEFTFVFLESKKWPREQPWERKTSNDAFGVFERFLKLKNWFVN